MTTFIAQVVGDWWAPLTGTGVAGVMLYWATRFIDTSMKSMEGRLKALEESNRAIPDVFRDAIKSLEIAVDRMAKASLLRSVEQHDGTFKEQIRTMLKDIEDKERNRS